MEHTITANGIRHGRVGGLVLSQLQIGLAAGCAIVACLTAFGGGVIVGMWYKASEQITPLSATLSTPAAEKSSASPDSATPAPSEQPVTFYNTLTGHQAAYAPLTPQAVAPAPPAGPASTPRATPPVPAAAVPPPREEAASAAKPAPAPTPKATAVPSTSGTRAEAIATAARAAAAASERQKQSTPVAAQKPVPTAPATASARPVAVAPAVAQKPAARERPSGSATPAPAAAKKATSGEDFSVQVGSFGNSDQAERLRTSLAQKGYPVRVQLSEVPGQGLRYRVRVGNYADRAAADQSAHHLTAQEQVPAIVAGKN